ncbi:MAG: ATP-binding protein [Planctomycetota bacterium]
MIRRISTKWVLAVLAVVVLPFLGFAWYVDAFVSRRFADDVVRYHLLGHAAELAERLDRLVEERRQDAQVLVVAPAVSYALTEGDEENPVFRSGVESLFNRLVAQIGASEFVIAIDRRGKVVVTNARDSVGVPVDPWTLDAIRSFPWAEQPWFAEALRTGAASLDVAPFGFVHEEANVPVEARYHFGFAQRVFGRFEALGPLEPVGLVVTLVPWSAVQEEVESYGVRRRLDTPSDVESRNIYDSTYAWVWASDADTILAHPRRELYGARVSEDPVSLPQMVDAARTTRWGMYPDYTFNGIRKKAAFRHGHSPEDGGFGWVVGVGVDFPDIYGPIHEITTTIAEASTLVLLVAIIVTVVVARRTTRPVQDLEAFTRRVASGDLDAQVPVRGHDELADLARSFNRMTGQLKENRAQLVEAEKDAAWREMARQVAHEIKNPLTPIQLSASLLKRAYDEESPEFPKILDRTIDVVQRQVRNMRDIAQDFYRFAGEHRDPVPVDASAMLDEVFELNAAWAESEGVQLARDASGNGAAAPADSNGSRYVVEADPDELRRALVNLVSNAIEASDETGGEIRGAVDRRGGDVRITIRDTGRGIDEDTEEHLFDPYFTTRSSGTGLGLAIVRRIVEDLGGSVDLRNAAEGQGAVATIVLPHHVDPGGTRPDGAGS